MGWNSNKRSIVIDLVNPVGRDLLLRMLPNYDVFVENYGPGVIEKLDIGYDVMLQARGFVKKIDHPELGAIPLLGWPARLSKSEVPIEPAPLLGQHTREVLSADLGLAESELHTLRERGAIEGDD